MQFLRLDLNNFATHYFRDKECLEKKSIPPLGLL